MNDYLMLNDLVFCDGFLGYPQNASTYNVNEDDLFHIL